MLLFNLVKNQIKNLYWYLSGKPLIIAPLGSTTLDLDDVKIAKKWLYNSKTWDDIKVVREFESQFSKWNGSKFSFAFTSGRVALSACIYGIGLRKGDEVILPGYTCVVVPNALKFAGIIPIYSDIELDTYGLDISKIEQKITLKTKAILLQHLYGLVCRDYELILSLAKKYNLKIIEDCAHSTGASYKNKKVGTWGDVGFYSSEQSKIFNTLQGGIAVTNDPIIAEKIKQYQNDSIFPNKQKNELQLKHIIFNYYKYKHPWRVLISDFAKIKWGRSPLISTSKEEEMGIQPAFYQCKMSAPIAAIASNQLKKIDKYNQRRREQALQWDLWCDKNSYTKPLVIKNSIPVYLRYPVLVEEWKKKDKNWARNELHIDLGVWFVSQIHPNKNIKIKGCENSEIAVKQCVNFPCLK